MCSRACQVLASLHRREREPSLSPVEVTFSAFASQISSKNGKTKGTRHSPDMTTLRYLKNRAEHVTSGPMMCTMVHIMLAHARERVAMSPVLSKVGIKIGQYDDAGSNGDNNMSIVAIDS